jgi:AcrR family transcriptional regulator
MNDAPPAVSPVGRRTQAERSALSDRRMTEAAVELLASQGLAGTTLAGIGQAAGYSRGLATQRFGSKAGLLRHVLKRASQEWLRRLDLAVGGKTGLEALDAALDSQVGYIREAPNDVRAMYLLWFQSIDPGAEYRPNVAEVHRRQRETVAGWIRQGQSSGRVAASADPRKVAEYFCAAATGIVFHWLVNSDFALEGAVSEMKAELANRLRPAAAAAPAVWIDDAIHPSRPRT